MYLHTIDSWNKGRHEVIQIGSYTHDPKGLRGTRLPGAVLRTRRPGDLAEPRHGSAYSRTVLHEIRGGCRGFRDREDPNAAFSIPRVGWKSAHEDERTRGSQVARCDSNKVKVIMHCSSCCDGDRATRGRHGTLDVVRFGEKLAFRSIGSLWSEYCNLQPVEVLEAD